MISVFLFVFNITANNYNLGKQIIANTYILQGHDNTQERKVWIIMESYVCTEVEMRFLRLTADIKVQN
jgi:hypothetical protein